MVYINLPGPPVEFESRQEGLRFGALTGALMGTLGGGFLGFALGGLAGVIVERWGFQDDSMFVAATVAAGIGALGSFLAAEHRGAWKASLATWILGTALGCLLVYLTERRFMNPERGRFEISLALTGGMTCVLLAVPNAARRLARQGFTEGDRNSRKLLALSDVAGALAWLFGPARAQVSYFLAALMGASISGLIIGIFVQSVEIFGVRVAGWLFCLASFNLPALIGAAMLWNEGQPLREEVVVATPSEEHERQGTPSA